MINLSKKVRVIQREAKTRHQKLFWRGMCWALDQLRRRPHATLTYGPVVQAWELYKTKKLDQLVDPVMRGDITAKEAVRFLKVGLLCVQEKCDRRPKISKAMSLMSDDEINLDDLLISQPGIITDIMDVKLGRRRSTSQGITSTPSHRLYNFWPGPVYFNKLQVTMVAPNPFCIFIFFNSLG